MSPRRWSAVVLGTAALTAVLLAFAPLTVTRSCSASPEGRTECSSDTASLVESEGMSVLAVLAVPVLVALAPLVAGTRRSRMISALVLTAAVVVAAASIGIFFLPTMLLAWAAVVAGRGGGVLAGGYR